MNSRHLLFCAVLLVAGIVLLFTGVAAFAFLPLLLCGLMMGGMIWMMMRPGRQHRGDR